MNDADAGKIMKVVFGSVGSGPNDVFPVIAEEIAVSVYHLEIVHMSSVSIFTKSCYCMHGFPYSLKTTTPSTR